MGSVSLAEFGSGLIGIYRATRRPRTAAKLEAVLGELGRTIVPPGEARGALVSDLDSAGLGRWLAATGPPRRSPNTMIGLLGYARSVVAHAMAEGLVDREPNWRLLRPRRAPPRRARHHSAEEVRRLLRHLRERAPRSWKGRRDYALVGLVALAALRRDEALYLRWQDIHLAGGYIAIEPHELRPLKTAESAQAAPLCPELADIVEGWRPWVPAGCPWYNPGVELGMPWANGRPGCRPIDRLKAAAREVGIESITWQSLRTSWGTQAATRWRLTDREITVSLRHSDPGTSLRYYCERDLENVRLLGRRIGYGH